MAGVGGSIKRWAPHPPCPPLSYPPPHASCVACGLKPPTRSPTLQSPCSPSCPLSQRGTGGHPCHRPQPGHLPISLWPPTTGPHETSRAYIPVQNQALASNPCELQDARKTQQSKWCPCKEHYTNIRIRSQCSLIGSNHFNPINPSRLCPGCFFPSPKECDGIGDPRSSLL